MNKPIVIGQTTEFSAQRNAPARVIKLAKPDGGQAYTVTLGYDQNFKLDLSGIANEKITLVHVGERLIILFDNQSTLTINPFYDSANAILGNISFDVGDARVIDGTQFAGIFPITEDQSVLPAAGEGGPQAGANFRDASVDPLSTPDPLDLLPPEELGNFVINDIIGRNDDTIEPLRFLGLRLIVEEDQLGHGEVGLFPALSDGNEGPTSFNHETGAEDDFDNDPSTVDGDDDSWNDLDNTTQQFKAQLVVTGGSGNHVYSLLSLADYNSSFKSQGEVIRVHIDNATGVLTGYVDQGAAGLGGDDRVVFTLQLTTAGQVTFTIYDQLDHPSLDGLPGDNEENNLLMDLSGLIIVSDTVTLQSLALTDVIVTIIDDVPVLTGRKDIVVVDEDDIKTLHDGLPGGSLGTHPNDGNGDGSYTGDSWNNAGGPATVTGSLKDLVRIGADEWPTQEKPSEGGGSENPMPAFVPLSSLNGPFNFKDGEDTDLSYLQALGLSSKGGPLSYDIQDNVLYGFVNVGQPGVVYNEGFDRLVFKLTLETDGDYKFELYDQLDHDAPPFGADQNYDLQDDVPGDVYFIDFGNLISVTDFDGDSIGLDGKLIIKVRDDVPELIPCDPIELRVDEDDIRTNLSLGTSPNDGNADGSYTGNPNVNQPGPANVSGSLQGPGGVVVSGADEPLTFSFTGNAKSYFTNLGLSSKGEELSYHIQDGVLYGYVNKQFEGPFGPNDRIVFKFTLENDGDFKFELFDQLDHDLGDGQNYGLQDDVPGDVMWLEFGDVIKATDYDGDSVVLKDMLKIKVKDDVPEVAPCDPIVLTVDEDDIKTVNFTSPTNVNPGSTGTSPNDSNGDGSYTGNPANNNPGPAFVSGSLASVVQSGADEKLTFGFISESALRSYLENLGLQSQGSELSYDLQGNKLIAFDNAGNSLGQSYDDGDDRLVFTFELNPTTGAFEFKLYDQLDHDAPNSGAVQNYDLEDDLPGNGDVEYIDFGNILKATDFDGDSVVLEDMVKIRIRDDVPELSGKTVVGVVDEDDIDTPWSQGTSPNDGDALDGSFTEDGPGNVNPAYIDSEKYGSLAGIVNLGADERADGKKFFFNGSLGDVEAKMDALGLYSKNNVQPADQNGLKIYHEASIDGNWLVIEAFEPDTPGPGNTGNPVYELRVNQVTGEWEFRLFDELIHDLPPSANEFDLRSNNGLINGIDFGSVLKVMDADGDSVALTGQFTIKVHDDTPEAKIKLASNEYVTHDETPGDDGNDDTSFGNLPGSAQSAFNSISAAIRGDDPHVPGSGAIGYAYDSDAIVINDTEVGADAPPASQVFSLRLKNGVSIIDSGLDTTEGKNILLVVDPNNPSLVLGRVDENGDGQISGNGEKVAFAIHINQDGEISVAQYLSIKHDDRGDFDENNDDGFGDDANPDEPNYHPVQQTLGDTLEAVLTVTDSDGDVDSDSVAIGSRIIFEDDGPYVKVKENDHKDADDIKVTLDETTFGGIPNDDTLTDTWVASTTVNPANAIGRVKTPESDDGISVADLFEVEYDGGADGVDSVVKTFALTLRDDNGKVVTDDSTGIETTMRVTRADGTALDMSATARTIWLFKQDDGSILGVVGQNSGQPGDEHVALRIYLTGGSDPQLVIEQYLPIEHPTGGSSQSAIDEAIALFLKDSDAGVDITYTVTVTDKDGDSATSSHSIEIIDHNSSIVSIQDDGPTVDVSLALSEGEVAALTLNLDETVQPNGPMNAGYDRNLTPEVADGNGGADDVDPTGAPVNVYNRDPNISSAYSANTAIGRKETAPGQLSALFDETIDFGTDGANDVNSIVRTLSFELTGGSPYKTNLVVTGLTKEIPGDNLSQMDDTERTIALTIEGGAIVGRIPGDNGDNFIAFRISIQSAGDPANAKLVVEQFLPIDHGDTVLGDTQSPSRLDEEAILKLIGDDKLLLKLTTTIKDGDGDTHTDSATVTIADKNGSFVAFDDDGPVAPTVTASAAFGNGLFFDGFASNSPTWGPGSGIATGTAGGWTITPSDGSGSNQLERVGEPFAGTDSPTNSLIVDLEASPGNVQISQTINGLTNGATYKLVFEAGQANFGDASMEVVWNGNVIAVIEANTGPLQTYMVNLLANGPSGTLVFREVGVEDNTGTYLANIKIVNLIIDETAGIDAGASDTTAPAVIALFNGVANKGTDPDGGLPQYAKGLAPAIVIGTANYGTDGPAAVDPMKVGLNLSASGVDSGLKTTNGQTILLFVEGDLVVGRYDSNGVGGVTGADIAAFAIAIDNTGTLSVAQYISLFHPEANTHNEGVYLAPGVLKATVTLTDGDGDKVTSTADISAAIRFEDDGPDAKLYVSMQGGVTLDESVRAGDEDNDDDNDGNPFDGDAIATKIVAGSVLFSDASTYGADGPKDSDNNGADADAKVFSLTLTGVQPVDSGLVDAQNDQPVLLSLVGGVVEGWAGGQKVLTISINSANGETTITQLRAVEHNDSNDHDENTSPEVMDAGVLKLTVTVKDDDGDSDSDSIDLGSLIKFEDDGPKVLSVTKNEGYGDELIVNGSFEQGIGNLPAGQWNIYKDLLPGWVMGANGVPFELQNGGIGGAGVPDGNIVVELDGDTAGNTDYPLPPQGQPAPNGATNATIQQTVENLTVGQTYELTFFYAPRQQGETSGMTVSFGNQVVWTSTGNEPAGFQQITVTVTAQNATQVLAFTGTGTENEYGALLDQVSLKADYNKVLDDEDLVNGIQGTAPNGDDGQGLVASGKVNFDAGSDGLKSISIAGFNGLKAIYVDNDGVGHQESVTMTWDAGTKTLTGSTANIAQVFTLTIDNSGDYIFTLKAPLVHPEQEGAGYENNLSQLDFTVTVTDGDDDTATGVICINVDDDIPVAVDEGTPLSSVEESAAPVIIGTTATLLANDAFGADGEHATTPLTIASPGSLGGTVTIDINGNLVYTPPANIDSPSLVETFTYTITDGDGDTDTATFTVTVTNRNSIPEIEVQPSNVAVDEDGLTAIRNLDAGPLLPTETDGNELAVNTGTVSINYGDDIPANPTTAFSFLLTGLNGQLTTTDGTPVTFAFDGAAILGSAGVNPALRIEITGAVPTGGGEVQYTYQVTLYQPLHHPELTGQPGDDTENPLSLLNVQFQVTDSNGDQLPVPGSFDVSILDDVPDATDEAQAEVYEGLQVVGTFDFVPGADGAKITHVNGVALTFVATPGGYSDPIDLGPGIGTLEVMATGAYKFTAANPLDNTPPPVVNGNFTVTDGDGDSDTANFSFKVLDVNVPKGEEAFAEVDDDGLTGGNPFGQAGDQADANLDNDFTEKTFSGNLNGVESLDTPNVYSFSEMNGDAWTLGQESGTYSWSGNKLTAIIGDPSPRAGNALFEVEITNTATGDFTVTLLDNVVHLAGPNAENDAGVNNTQLVLSYRMTDGDDSVDDTGTLAINFDDDAPTAYNDTETVGNAAVSSQHTGNVISGVGTNEGAGNADQPGADGATVTSFVGAGAPVNAGASTSGSHGTLVINADGSYIYTRTQMTGGSDVFTYTLTDGDGDTTTATLTFTLDNIDTTPTSGSATVYLDEDVIPGLQPGNPGGTNDIDAPHTFSGVLPGNFDLNGPAANDAVSFAPMHDTNVVINDITVRFDWNAGTDTLTAYLDQGDGDLGAGDTTFFTVQVTNPALREYTVTLVNPLRHHTNDLADDVENSNTFDLKYVLTDSDGDPSPQGTLSVVINDDTPTALNDTASVNEGVKPTMNAILVIDLSTSMNGTVSPGVTRLDLLQAAVANLLNSSAVSYKDILIYTFNDGATFEGKFNVVGNAITEVNSYDSGDLVSATEYDSTVVQIAAHFPTQLPLQAADLTNLFFLTDGDPQGGSSIDPGTEANNWLTFLNTYIDQVTAVGFGGIVNTTFIDPVAPRAEDDAIAVTNPADLAATLTGSLPAGSIDGNVLSNVGEGFGEDAGYIQSITINGVTYTYDGNNTVTESAATPGGYIDHGKWIEVPTTLGGKLTFYFAAANGEAAGYWAYQAPSNVPATTDEVFTYVLVDGDGDNDDATLTITVNNINKVPTAGEVTGAVDDEGLAHGIVGNGTPVTGDDAGNATSAGGMLPGAGGDGALAWSFAGMVGPGTVGQDNVNYTYAAGVLTATIVGGDRAGLTLFTVTLTESTGAYTFNLVNPIKHLAGNSENGDIDLLLNYTVSDTDSVADDADGTLTITLDDDAPVNFTAQSMTIANSGSATGSGALNFYESIGADGGSVVFTGTAANDGTSLTRSGSSTVVTSGGKTVKLFGFGTGELMGRIDLDDNGFFETDVFKVTLNPSTSTDAADLYNIEFFRALDDGAGFTITPTNFTNTSSAAFKVAQGSSDDDILVSAVSSPNNRVNGSNGGGVTSLGAGGGVEVGAGELLRFDFATGVVLNGESGNNDFNTVSGSLNHYNANGFAMTVDNAGGSSSIKVIAYDADNDKTLSGDLGDVKDTISAIYKNGILVPLGSLVAQDGGYIVPATDNDIITVFTSTGFNRVEAIHAGGEAFALYNVGYLVANTGDPVPLTFSVTATDGDGDQSTGTISVTAAPVNDPPVLSLFGGTVTSGNISDNFASGYSGGTGWTGAWNETDVDSSSAGEIRIASDQLRLGGGDGASIIREANLLGKDTATLSFSFGESGTEANQNEQLIVYFAADGTNYVEVARYDADDASGTKTIPLTGPFDSDAKVQFTVTSTSQSTEYFVVDNVNIAYSDQVAPSSEDYSAAYTENASGVSIASSPSITDVDDTNMVSAQIVLTNAKAGDTFTFAGLPAGITGALVAGAGTLTVNLTGNSSMANYQAAIAAVLFSSTAENADDRIINVTVNDGDGNSNTATTTIVYTTANDAPAGENKTINVTEDITHTFTAADFGFTDADGNAFAGVFIDSVPGNGSLRLGNAAIAAGAFVSADQIADGMLIFSPGDNDNDDATFTFSVRDNGANGSGSVNEDPTPNTITLNFTTDLSGESNSSGNNHAYTASLSGPSFSIQDADNNGSGGATANDSLRIDTTAGTVFTALNFLHSDNNEEINWTSGGSSRTVTLLNQFSSGNSNGNDTDVETLTLQNGGTFAGYSLGNSAYDLDLDLSGDGDADIVAGTAAAETLNGGAGNDLLFGNGGDDILIGGQGADLLVGGLGQDTFRWLANDQSGSPTDFITDFTVGAGGDILDLDALLSGTVTNATPVGTLDDYIQFSSSSGNTTIQIDHDGGGTFTPTMTIQLTGVDLTAGGANSTQDILQNMINQAQLQV